MTNPASTSDLADRWRPLSSQEETNGEVFLDDAWRMLRRKVEGIDDLIEDDPDFEGEVVRILCAAVLRVMKNPDGKRQESIDDYSWTRDQALSAGLLYFTADELGDLTPDGNSGAFMGDLLAGWSDAWETA